MRHSIRNYFCAALIAGFIPSFAPLAHADKATDIQMLPPLSFDYKSICGGTSGSPQLLAWDGTNPINCIPGVTGDQTGLLTAPTIHNTNLTSTTINSAAITNSQNITSKSVVTSSLFLPNIFVQGSLIDVTNTVSDLTAMGGCTNGAALTKNTNGTFGCITVADIPNVGTTFVQQCSTPGTMLYFDNTNGFSCQPIPYPAIPPFPPACTGGNILQYNGSSYVCSPAASVVPPPPPAAGPPGSCYDSYHALRSIDGVNLVCSPIVCTYDGNPNGPGNAYINYWNSIGAPVMLGQDTTPQLVPLLGVLSIVRDGGGDDEFITCTDTINNVFTPGYTAAPYVDSGGGGGMEGGGSTGGY